MDGVIKCRLWWPIDISQPPGNHSFLFGWFLQSSRSSFDVIVAFCCNEIGMAYSGHRECDLEKILKGINESLPSGLQQKSDFSFLGLCETDFRDNLAPTSFQNGEADSTTLKRSSCGCLEQSILPAIENCWMKLVIEHSDKTRRRVPVIPIVDHLHFDNKMVSRLDLHVIFYKVPTFRYLHYSLHNTSSSKIGPSCCKKPYWFDRLHRQAADTNLVYVIQMLNSVRFTRMLLSQHSQRVPSFLFVVSLKFSTIAWKIFAFSVASLSTIVYIILQFFHAALCWLSFFYIDKLFIKAMSNSLKNVNFRCCQFLNWPIFLQDQNSRDYSCVELAENAEFKKHSIWSNLIVDTLLGNLFGILLWYMADPLYLGLSYLANDLTNNWLRSGCVWLMGNPAGFKLNTELAGFLGIISLNVIQIWCALMVFMGSLVPFTKALALFALFFGFTSMATLVIDMISLATVHVWILRVFFSLIYSMQIQAVAALWRLFRGRKYNHLRHRLDSYEYTVDQHVVGSLLFIPILLLLPTTSVFYIFFTISHTVLIILYVVVEASISVFHHTPYAKIFLWLKRRQRFPSGIWLDVLSTSPLDNKNENFSHGKMDSQSILFLSLRSNLLSLGNLISPYYSSFWLSYSKSCKITSIAHALLTGTSIPSPPGLVFPIHLEWIAIPWKEYWCTCRDSVYACRSNPLHP